MLNIPDSLIVNHSNSPQTYQKGLEYYRRGRIKSLKILEDRNTILSIVKGTREYSIRITFDQGGTYQEASCTCPSGRQYWGHCKHIVAVLMHLKWLKENDGFRNVLARKTAREIFTHFERNTATAKTPVHLEVTYEFRSRRSFDFGTKSMLSFKIGTNKRYMIRSIPKFFKQLEAGEAVEFGKGFTFDPYWHEFCAPDRPLAEFLKEVYEVSRYSSQGYGSLMGIFKDKYLLLTDTMVKRFFALMGEQAFPFILDGHEVADIRIINKNVPIHFRLDSQSGDLCLDIDMEGPIHPITVDGEFMLMGQQIFKPSKEQVRHITPFLLAMHRTGNKRLTFLNEDKERFVSEVLPFAQKAGTVDISENVNKLIIKADLLAQVYLDREGAGIKARVKFIYDEREIDPFDPKKDSSNKDGQILLRDTEGERQVLDVFEQHAFLVRPESVFLEEEDLIFDFLHTGIPRLGEAASVYYAEDFKMKLRDKTSYTAGVRLSTQTDFLEFSFDIGGMGGLELDRIFAALREKKRYYRFKDGSFLSLEAEELIGLSQLVEDLGIKGKDFKEDTFQIPKYRALYLDRQLKDAGIVDVTRNKAYNDLVRDIKEPGELDIKIPEVINGTLRDYQRIGFKWLKTLSHYGFGGILADDMGLGKTLQVLALLFSEKGNKPGEPSLVIAPTSLIYNWEAEVEKFLPDIRTLVIAGTKVERLERMETIPSYDLVITSYPLIRRDQEDYLKYDFKYCLIDEAQHIKNPASQGAKAVKSIKAKHRFALSGTPMENSLTELWSIFDFVMPGYLYTHTKFMQRFERPIVKDKDEEAAMDFSRHIQPFVLRRLKTDVLKDLPEKIENKMVADLTEEQKKVYLAYLSRVRSEITSEIDRSGYQKNQIKILSALTRLRQICCHPAMFLEDYKGDSGKLLLLEEIIADALEGGHRILLFSQFTSMLAIIRKRLDQMKIQTLYLDGNTETLQRGKLVKEFNEGQGEVFLISLKAGGTGLNLIGADTVIHYDPWWNPAVEDQASDRAYRIGQKKVVHVMRLIAKGTIEEKIEQLKAHKRNLTDAVIKPGETFISKMTEQEVMSLFEL